MLKPFTMESVQELVRGSEAIDKMKNEIKIILSIILSFLNSSQNIPATFRVTIALAWVGGTPYSIVIERDGSLEFTASLCKETSLGMIPIAKRKVEGIPAHLVITLHRTLPVLLTEVVDRLAGFGEHWITYAGAASYYDYYDLVTQKR